MIVKKVSRMSDLSVKFYTNIKKKRLFPPLFSTLTKKEKKKNLIKI